MIEKKRFRFAFVLESYALVFFSTSFYDSVIVFKSTELVSHGNQHFVNLL